MKLLAQLSFSQVVSRDLAQDAELMVTLKRLLSKKINTIDDENEAEIYEEILRLAEQIKWNLNENRQKSYLTDVIKTVSSEHVMISYNPANREQCFKIKERIESFGFKVWINANGKHGSSLDEMAKAVDSSICVLICVTEKYRQSIHCQAEAQYAFRMNKNIIPLIMQEGYEKVKGWLGVVMGDKAFVNFNAYKFDVSISHLKQELEAYSDKAKPVDSPNLIEHTISDHKSEPSQYPPSTRTSTLSTTRTLKEEKKALTKTANEWTDVEVNEWFAKNNLNMAIYEYLQAHSGKILKQMYQIKSSSSEFFFHSLREIEGIKFHEIILFASCLDELFTK